jgi:hypothetical protein
LNGEESVEGRLIENDMKGLEMRGRRGEDVQLGVLFAFAEAAAVMKRTMAGNLTACA